MDLEYIKSHIKIATISLSFSTCVSPFSHAFHPELQGYLGSLRKNRSQALHFMKQPLIGESWQQVGPGPAIIPKLSNENADRSQDRV